MYTVGYDIGTRFIKICLVKDKVIIASHVTEPGRDINSTIKSAYSDVLEKAGIYSFRIKNSAATGFGSGFVKKSRLNINLPLALARGTYQADNNVKTVIDTGGLFINICSIGKNGKLIDTIVNEKCAAGSGRFIETIARAVELPFEKITEEISNSPAQFHITSNCSVFAESEVVSRVNNGGNRGDIINGLLHALVTKTETMLGMMRHEGSVAFTGGVAMIEGYRKILQERLGMETISLPVDLRIIPAFGAALIAAEKI